MSGNFYGIYSSCRDAAWRCQLHFEVCRLPVKVVSIARRAGIRVVKNTDVGELRRGESGVSICDGSDWIIVYDNRLGDDESRIVVAHELGHIFLGHDYLCANRRFENGSQPERAADLFAMRLLAPAFALHELKITDADRIAGLCRIPHELAFRRAHRMRQLELRESYYKSPLERELLERFRPWLDECRPILTDHTDVERDPAKKL